jgi:putative oxidoreductase
MKGVQDPWVSLGLLILRVGTGVLLLYGHGWDKLVHFGEKASRFPDPIGLGSEISLALVVFAEVICAALLVAGLWTRLAAVPIIIFMLVAVFAQHAGDPWAKKEMAVLYLIPVVTLVLTGAGIFSLDSVFFGRGKKGD